MLYVVCCMLYFFFQTPHPLQKPARADNRVRAPDNCIFKWSHKHFVDAERIRAELGDDVVGVYDIPPSLAHLAPVLALNVPLIFEAEKRLDMRDKAEVKKHLVPEAGVD